MDKGIDVMDTVAAKSISKNRVQDAVKKGVNDVEIARLTDEFQKDGCE